MPAYFRSTVAEFVNTSRTEVLAKLTLHHANDGFTEMKTDTPLTWWRDLDHVQGTLAELCRERPAAAAWGILLEFTVPRKSSRLDIVLLAGEQIVLLECKSGQPTSEARQQVEHYALLLHYFHRESQRRHLLPVVVSPVEAPAEDEVRQMFQLRQGLLGFDTLPSYWIAPVQVCSWTTLTKLLCGVDLRFHKQIEASVWELGAYHPTPTIIEAACALRTGLNIREIAMSEAAEHDIAAVTDAIHRIVTLAQTEKQHAICFLTGVPGSGKTLVGLSIAHLSADCEQPIPFMSGNGPLVAVLQEVFRRQAMRDGVPSTQALIQARTLIENIHLFAKEYTEKDVQRPPSNHVVIFDEAQRAWDRAQNLSKFQRNYSEPEMLLQIMQRHSDWACVIALVGGGQEINSGEAGLEEWGRAIETSSIKWNVFASPEVIRGGTSTAGRKLFEGETPEVAVQATPLLHLRTSNRSLRAEDLAEWVNLVLMGKAEQAASLRIASRFPVFLTRDLGKLRTKLQELALGESRYGLVGSSKAARLRAEGLEADSNFHNGYPWHHWYLSPRADVRSSFACEVFATEFEIQGLELDWIGMCWGGDLIWSGTAWHPRKWHQSDTPRWIPMKRDNERHFRRNAYRVLLTRARQGMVLFVPKGSTQDPSRNPSEMDSTAEFLLRAGVVCID